MADVLVSPLGRSPGAVSGMFFALKAQRDIEIEQVVTVGTSHPQVRSASANYLSPLFEYLQVAYDPIHIPASDLREGRKNIAPFVAMIELALKNAQEAGHRVHVAVTGGRSGMGALAALATNFYGADHLWHLWVSREIEDGGTVDKLFGLTEPEAMVNSPYLNPTVDGADSCEVVDLPFVDLRPLHDVLWTWRRTGQMLDPSSALALFFKTAGIQRFQDIFPAGLTFVQADDILTLKTQFARSTPQDQYTLMAELGTILHEAGVVDEIERQQLVDMVAGQARDVFAFAETVRKDRTGFWEWVKQRKDEIGVAMAAVGGVSTALGTLLKALELYLKANGYMP